MGGLLRLTTTDILRVLSYLAITLILKFPISFMWIIIEMIKVNTLRVARCFGTEALNLRITDKDPLTKERLDNHLDRYGHIFRAFVLKRRLLRSEIWPKIHIIDGVPAEEAHHLGCQGLFSIKKYDGWNLDRCVTR